MLGVAGSDISVGFGDGLGIGEVFVDLVVEVVAIGDDEEGPVTGNFTQDFLAEEDHGVAFAAALGVPEDAEFALVVLDFADGLDGLVDAEELVVFGDDFDKRAFSGIEKGVVFDEVEESVFFTGALDNCVEGDDPRFGFVADLFPLAEVVPGCGGAADDALAAVGEENDGVVVEELGDGGFVVLEVLFVGEFELFVVGFEFDEDEGKSVDEADEIGAFVAIFAGDPELGDHEEMVVVWVVPVDDAEGFELFFVVIISVSDFDARFEELVGFLVGAGDRLAITVALKFVYGTFDRNIGDIGIELVESGAEVAL